MYSKTGRGLILAVGIVVSLIISFLIGIVYDASLETVYSLVITVIYSVYIIIGIGIKRIPIEFFRLMFLIVGVTIGYTVLIGIF